MAFESLHRGMEALRGAIIQAKTSSAIKETTEEVESITARQSGITARLEEVSARAKQLGGEIPTQLQEDIRGLKEERQALIDRRQALANNLKGSLLGLGQPPQVAEAAAESIFKSTPVGLTIAREQIEAGRETREDVQEFKAQQAKERFKESKELLKLKRQAETASNKKEQTKLTTRREKILSGALKLPKQMETLEELVNKTIPGELAASQKIPNVAKRPILRQINTVIRFVQEGPARDLTGAQAGLQELKDLRRIITGGGFVTKDQLFSSLRATATVFKQGAEAELEVMQSQGFDDFVADFSSKIQEAFKDKVIQPPKSETKKTIRKLFGAPTDESPAQAPELPPLGF